MTLDELYAALSYGELNSLSIGLEGTGEIAEQDQPRIISYTNRALTRLYTRFSYNRHYVHFELHDDVRNYRLHPDFAESNQAPAHTTPLYIKDSVADPFPGNLLKIRGLRNEEAECERDRDIPINDLSLRSSPKLLKYDTLYFAEPEAGTLLTAEVVLKHAPIALDAAPSTEIDLHPLLEEALVFHVAARVMASIGGEDASLATQRLFAEYERVCIMAEHEDLAQQSHQDTHEKMERGGWI